MTNIKNKNNEVVVVHRVCEKNSVGLNVVGTQVRDIQDILAINIYTSILFSY